MCLICLFHFSENVCAQTGYNIFPLWHHAEKITADPAFNPPIINFCHFTNVAGKCTCRRCELSTTTAALLTASSSIYIFSTFTWASTYSWWKCTLQSFVCVQPSLHAGLFSQHGTIHTKAVFSTHLKIKDGSIHTLCDSKRYVEPVSFIIFCFFTE